MNKICPKVPFLINIKKNKTIPKELIYKHSLDLYEIEGLRCYTIFTTKKPYSMCRMITFPEYIERDGIEGIRSLYINNLYSIPVQQGLGSKMLNYAKIVSKEQNCNGFFHLESCSIFSPNKIPHVFYKKMGMNTEFKSINNDLDKFIRKNKNATSLDFDSVTMYYPPIKSPKTDLQVNVEMFKEKIIKYLPFLRFKLK